jgi:hypothetical protein
VLPQEADGARRDNGAAPVAPTQPPPVSETERRCEPADDALRTAELIKYHRKTARGSLLAGWSAIISCLITGTIAFLMIRPWKEAPATSAFMKAAKDELAGIREEARRAATAALGSERQAEASAKAAEEAVAKIEQLRRTIELTQLRDLEIARVVLGDHELDRVGIGDYPVSSFCDSPLTVSVRNPGGVPNRGTLWVGGTKGADSFLECDEQIGSLRGGQSFDHRFDLAGCMRKRRIYSRCNQPGTLTVRIAS